MQPNQTPVNPPFAYHNVAMSDISTNRLYQVPVPGPMPMPLYDCNVNSEQSVQHIPWSEIQNSMAMVAYCNEFMRREQTMSGGFNLPKDQFGHGSTSMAGARSDDNFMMYCFKIQQCPTVRGHHDWTDCLYLHQGEKARRRDPRKCLYAGKPCADFRKRGQCENGDRCQFAHGVFETWLHPDKYKTQMCRDLGKCERKVCFFAHSAGELREGDGVMEDMTEAVSSPKSILTMDKSPPQSPPETDEITKGMEMLRLKAIQDGVQSTVNAAAPPPAKTDEIVEGMEMLNFKFNAIQNGVQSTVNAAPDVEPEQEETDQYVGLEPDVLDWIAELLEC